MAGNNHNVHIDHRSPVPVYRQIAGIIRVRIETGRETGIEGDESYPPGRPIPSLERIRQETGADTKTIPPRASSKSSAARAPSLRGGHELRNSVLVPRAHA